MIGSEQVTLKDVVDDGRFFSIPIYQRLYVWGEEQIGLLLDDLWSAFESEQQTFYLGTTLVVKRLAEQADQPGRYELIDGQQRFTTLWLLALSLPGCTSDGSATDKSASDNSRLADYGYAKQNGEPVPRISFAIRQSVEAWFMARIGRAENAGTVATDVPDGAQQLDAAITQIEGWLRQKPEDKHNGFAEFIYRRVQLVITEAAPDTDLNRLFEVINNRGVQLQHHEILKARILSRLPADAQDGYNQLWEACAAMNNYVERNLIATTDLSGRQLYELCSQNTGAERVGMPSASAVLAGLEPRSDQQPEGIALADILKGAVVPDTVKRKKTDEEKVQHQPVRSLISFPMLLLHTLRLHLWRNERVDLPRIQEKELLQLFTDHWFKDSPAPAEVQQFVQLLWEVRWLFDQHLVKWVETDTGEAHRLRPLRLSHSEQTLSRDTESREDDRSLILLQAMLYHSQSRATQYWLTPFLSYLLTQQETGSAQQNSDRETADQQRLLYLQHLDNQLLCTDDKRSLVVRSHALMENIWQHNLPQSLAILEEHSGTRCPHYWFYKLDYVLWQRLHQEKGERWKNFRMTARSSVEHITPQNGRDYDSNQDTARWRDCFGNLSLVSRELNSSFGNKPYPEKRAQFLGQSQQGVPSLKLDLIYAPEAAWNEQRCEQHQKEMLEHLRAYMDDIAAQVAALTSGGAEQGSLTPD